MNPSLFHTFFFIGWMWAFCQPLAAQSSLSFSGDYLSPRSTFSTSGHDELRGTSLKFEFREGPRLLGFEWYNGVRISYNCSKASRLNFGDGYILRSHSTSAFLTSRIISPKGKIRIFVEGTAGARQFFSTQKYFSDQLVDPIKEVPHSQMTFAAGLGGGIRIRTGQRTSVELQYTRLQGTPTQFVDTQNAQIIGGQVKFPLKESADTHTSDFRIGIVFEMGTIEKTRRGKSRRLKPAHRKIECAPAAEPEPEPEVAPEAPGSENEMPGEKG